MAKEKSELALTASLVASGTLLSRGLGFLRDILVAHYFSHLQTDVFYSAFRLPNLFRRLFGEGALTVSFIPVFSGTLKHDEARAKELASAIFTILFVLLSVLTALGTIYAAPVVERFTEGFSQVPGKMELTISQTQIMFGYVLLVSLYAYLMGILNSLKVFWLPAMAPALWNVSMILGILIGRNWFEVPSDILAWSTMVGGVLQLGILVPPLIKRGYMPWFTLKLRLPEVGQVFKAMAPSILGLSVMQLGVIINTHFASHLENGAPSWIFLADRILELPLALFAVSVGTVALPTLSRLWVDGKQNEMTIVSREALQSTLFLAIPCAVALFGISRPIVHTLFEHGQFSAHGADMTAAVIQIYGVGLVFAAGVRVVAPSFYAMKNTWLPAVAAAVALTVHILVAPLMMKSYGVQGLAMSSTLSGLINLIILLSFFRVFVGSLGWPTLLKSMALFFVCSLILLIPSPLYNQIIEKFGDQHLVRIVALTVTVTLCAFSYFLSAWILKVEECQLFVGFVRRRFLKK